MTSRPRLLRAILLLVGTATPALAADLAPAKAPDSCAALAQFGAYDTRATLTDADRADSFRNWMCQANIALESDLRVAATALGIAPDVLETTFGFDPNGGQDFLDWKHGFCATARGDQRVADQMSDFVKGITPGVATALAACEATPGLHARLVQGARQCDFMVHLSWTPSAGATAPKDVQVFATNPHVVCAPTALETPFAVTAPTDLLCTRHDDAAMVVMLASPAARVARTDLLMELPQALPDPQDLLGGDYQVDIAWRDRAGRYTAPTSDTWHLDLSSGVCKITGKATQYTPRSAWFSQSRASCSPVQIAFTGYRSFDPVAHQATQFTLTLRSEDNGATFQGSGQDSVGNTAVSVTARHKGTPPAPPDQVACKP